MEQQVSIAIVDDEEGILELMETILGELGDLKLFSNPVDALADITQNQPSLLITDQHMPELQGTDLIEKSLEVWPNLKCVVISGDIEFTEKAEFLKENGIPLIKKPFKSVYAIRDQIEKILSTKSG